MMCCTVLASQKSVWSHSLKESDHGEKWRWEQILLTSWETVSWVRIVSTVELRYLFQSSASVFCRFIFMCKCIETDLFLCLKYSSMQWLSTRNLRTVLLDQLSPWSRGGWFSISIACHSEWGKSQVIHPCCQSFGVNVYQPAHHTLEDSRIGPNFSF